MIYGYARVSTRGQDLYGNSLDDQERKLRDAGCETVFHDSYTGTKMERPEFTKLLGMLKKGDRLVVTKLDRFARSASGGIETIRELLNRGVTVHILNMGLLDNTPTGRLITNVLFCFAEFERDMIIERTMAGKEAAKANNPAYREGRKRIPVDGALLESLHVRQQCGEITVEECCKELDISRGTWYNLVKKTA